MFELLKACKRCGAKPTFSSYSFSHRESYAVVCCTTVSSTDKDSSINKWNTFNIEAPITFRFNRKNNEWEIYEPKT